MLFIPTGARCDTEPGHAGESDPDGERGRRVQQPARAAGDLRGRHHRRSGQRRREARDRAGGRRPPNGNGLEGGAGGLPAGDDRPDDRAQAVGRRDGAHGRTRRRQCGRSLPGVRSRRERERRRHPAAARKSVGLGSQ